jgi:hypothetical protein
MSPSILEIDLGDVHLPDDYDDGPFEVPDVRIDPPAPPPTKEAAAPRLRGVA